MKQRILLALGATLILLGAGCQGTVDADVTYNSSTPTTNTSSAVMGAQGTVVFSITSTAPNLSGVTAVYLTVDKIEMHSPAKGWLTVSNATKQYELLGPKANSSLALAAQARVPEGTYNQVRVQVKKIEVVKSRVRSEAKLPSRTIEVTGQFRVMQNSTTSINLDFLADQSLRVANNGALIFIPVVKIEARANSSATVTAKDRIVVTGGTVDTIATMGMDLHGAMQDNFTLDANSKLEIKGDVISLVETTTLKTGADVGVTTNKPVR